MNENYELMVREKEAKGLLQYWMDIVNEWREDDENRFNKDKYESTFEILESMILVYNIFAVEKCMLKSNEITNTYSLEYFE